MTKQRAKAHPGWHMVGGSIVIVWLVALHQMFVATPAQRLLNAAGLNQLRPGEGYLGAYYQGAKIGHIHWKIEQLDSGYHLTQHSRLGLRLAGTNQPINQDVHLWLNSQFLLTRFDFQMLAGPIKIKARGHMLPEGLRLVVDMAGKTTQRILPLSEPPLFDLTIPTLIASQPLQPKTRYRLKVFDPQRLSNQDTIIEVVGHEVQNYQGKLIPAVHIVRRTAGIELHSWLDSSGRYSKSSCQAAWS